MEQSNNGPQSHPLSEQEQAMQDTLLHIFRSLCHRSAVPRVPNTNAVAVVDRDGPQVIESPTTPPFNAQDQNTVFPSEISVPPLTIRDTHVIISGTSKVPRPSSVHQGGNEVQSREVLYGRPGAALEEHYQDLQGTQTENIKGPYFQHGLRAEEISAQSDVNALSGNGNPLSERSPQRSISRGDSEALNTSLDRIEKFIQSSISPCKTLDPLSGSSTARVATYDVNAFSDNGNTLSEGSPQPSISLGGKEVLNDQGDASLDRFKKSTLALLTLGTSIRDPYDSGRNLNEVSNVSHSQSLHAVSSEPVVAQFPVQNSMFRSAQKVNIGGNASLMNIARDNVVTNVVKYDRTHGLEKMEKHVSFTAQFDSSAQDPERICHPGTRQNLLKRMKDWIDDPSSTESIFWVHGPAGAGKSAIAQTIAQSCGRQKVPATFFFFRSDSGRNDGNKLFMTLAYQLAFSIPAIKDHIAQSLHERPDLPTKSVEIQFNNLIAQPFRSLAEAASQQSSPDSIIAAFNRCQQLAPVIIIDGVDECTDEKLQQRFLKIIGDAVKDSSFPFRFLICSRPEAHIEDTLNKFKALILPIDLAKLDDANRDIEKYLVDQFSSIASNRDLDFSWPGREVVQDIIYKSSGNFIFASVVIKVVGDEDSMPEDQLAIILNLKPPEGVSPFAVLDELYLEILRRQRHQDFLKTFLALLVGRTALSDSELHEDDAKLMNVSEKELHTKLRRMRALLKFVPHIDVYHQSFLDFLNQSSRSGGYYVSKQAGKRRYVELVVDSIVRYVSRVIENPDYHKTHHLSLNLSAYLILYPLHMPSEELQDVLQPLVQIQDEVLKLADSRVASDPLSCDKCTVFYIMHSLLLHLAMHRCIDVACNEVEESVTKGRRAGVLTSIPTDAMQSSLGNDLDSSLSSLFTHLQDTKLELSTSTTIINHTCSVLRFDCAEIAVKVRSISDAQRLVDFLVHLIDEKHILRQYEPDVMTLMSKAAQLVLRIFSRIPVLPRSLFLNVERITSDEDDIMLGIELRCAAALIWRVLDKNYIHLEMDLQGHSLIVPYNNHLRSEKWRQILPLDSNTVIELVLDVARATQYFHSMGVAPGHLLGFGNVYLDLNLRPRIRFAADSLTIMNPFLRYEILRYESERFLYEDSIFAFGCFFYAAYFNTANDIHTSVEERRRIVVRRPSKPEIPRYAWQLIQHCCAEDPRNRPTIDEVVKEMESWRSQPK